MLLASQHNDAKHKTSQIKFNCCTSQNYNIIYKIKFPNIVSKKNTSLMLALNEEEYRAAKAFCMARMLLMRLINVSLQI